MSDLTDTLRKAARDIAEQGHFGWGNSSSDAADRIEALEAVLRQARSCAYPVSKNIDPRGHRWSDAYLDQLLPAINDLLKD
jgi:hypothetical protein